MFALLLLLMLVLLVSVGLVVNVYLYKYRALGKIRSSITLDEQLFTYYVDVDASEVW